jgi:hypothetical protein
MIGRDLFQGIRMERNINHEQQHAHYSAKRLASNWGPDEFKPRALPLQVFAVPAFPRKYTVVCLTWLHMLFLELTDKKGA